MYDHFPKEHKKKPFRKTLVNQENKNLTKQFAAAAADGGDAFNVNIYSVLDNSPQNVYGGDAFAYATNVNLTEQENEAEIEEEDKKEW